ncbi:adenosine deaminase [Herbiconiux ginsengi]|uniref:Adenine deaminase n=1 Tax=Herbiconiux ginsengi TaxID=381665 RepID=A0A1H3Q7X0_9MICO|nr:adenosine deaminase [Herbiconiux ginsengi]SDZ09632.1 adenosine deaminase [Herbiconiux ginsengi]
MTDTTAPLGRLPFCELHVHIEGTLEPATIFELAAAKDIRLPYADEAELAALYDFSDLQSFLDLYYANMQVLQTEDDFEALGAAYLRRAGAAGVVHAEMFVDPQAHSVRGIPESVVLAGLHRAIAAVGAETGITASIIVCVLRDQPVDSAERMLDRVLESGFAIEGIGLDSAEVGYPPSLFRSVFERARAAGLHAVAHAGEEGPASYVWEALDVLGVERVDHGNRALDDAALVARLAADRIPLTLCPLSNVRLRVIPSIAEFPLRRMLDTGILVTINSDDPAYFGGYLDDNLRALRGAFDLGGDVLGLLARNSVEASFLAPARKHALLG